MSTPETWCHSCGRDEPVPPSGAYLVCVECGHVWATAAELLADHQQEVARFNREWQESPFIVPALDPESVSYCPFCYADL